MLKNSVSSSTIRNEFGKIQETEHQFQIHHENVQYSHCLTDHFQAFPNTAVKIVSKLDSAHKAHLLQLLLFLRIIIDK